MAPEEVFALIAHCHRAHHSIEGSLARLRLLTSQLPALVTAIRRLRDAADHCERLADTLDMLARATADQEATRQRRLYGLRDTVAWAAVAASAWSASGKGEAWAQSMSGRSPTATHSRSALMGSQPESRWDDAAAVLLGARGSSPAVRVATASHTSGVKPAMTMAHRIARIPHPATPIRIDTYQLSDGSRHADVFVAGTNQWSVGTGGSPFDMDSNLALVAGGNAASVEATSQAMRAAGVRPGDSVSFFGHSQGGMVATTLAESGVYSTRSLVTVGSPTGTLPVRGTYPALALEHSNDIVTGLGGRRLPTQHTVVIRDSGHARGDVYGAHSQDSYIETASQVDRSPGLDLSEFRPPRDTSAGQTYVFSANRVISRPRRG
jgi:hypothetical protein